MSAGDSHGRSSHGISKSKTKVSIRITRWSASNPIIGCRATSLIHWVYVYIYIFVFFFLQFLTHKITESSVFLCNEHFYLLYLPRLFCQSQVKFQVRSEMALEQHLTWREGENCEERIMLCVIAVKNTYSEWERESLVFFFHLDRLQNHTQPWEANCSFWTVPFAAASFPLLLLFLQLAEWLTNSLCRCLDGKQIKCIHCQSWKLCHTDASINRMSK